MTTSTASRPTASTPTVPRAAAPASCGLLVVGVVITLLGLLARQPVVVGWGARVLGIADDPDAGLPAAMVGPELSDVPLSVWCWLVAGAGAALLVTGCTRLLAAARRP